MTDFNTAIQNVIDAATADYARWCGLSEVDPVRQPFELTVKHGRSYSKIITMRDGRESCVWGFVVRKEGKFKYGDILKAASWKAPAMNHARGNIFTGFSGAQWTGPTYCGTDAQAENVARAEMQDALEGLQTV